MKAHLCALSLLVLTSLGAPARSEILLVDRARDPASNLPVRGLTAAQVEARFGAPAQRLEPRGGQKRQWPTINRWVYPDFTVYFEKNKVIDAVANKASPNEIGPKPPIR
jgi:hypothetical protein